MSLKEKLPAPALRILIRGSIAILFILAIILRISLYPVQTSDYNFFLSQWYDFIQTHGGFAALKYSFSNYNIPYLSLLAITTYLPIPKLIAIKTLSAVFDGVLGLFTFLILDIKFKRSYASIIGVLVVLFAPTIFINSAAWGQADATYAAFCLGSLYFLLKEKPLWACVFFALAISFKLQAIFFLPVLLVLLLKRKMSPKYLVLIPAIFLILLTPAFIAGRDTWSVLTIYAGQVSNGGNGQFTDGGQRQFNNGRPATFNGGGPGRAFGSSSSLTFNAPSIYQWLPTNAPDYWKWVGIALAAMVVVLVGLLLWRSKQQLTAAIILKIALVFVLAIPFFLPEMHERYFFLADVLSIVYAFYFPRAFYIAVIMQLCSLLSYAPYFFNTQIIELGFLSFGVFVITIIALLDLVLALYPDIQKKLAALATAPTTEQPQDEPSPEVAHNRVYILDTKR